MEWLEGLSLAEYKADALILAGDAGQRYTCKTGIFVVTLVSHPSFMFEGAFNSDRVFAFRGSLVFMHDCLLN